MLALPFTQSGKLIDADQKIGQDFVEVLQEQFGAELLFVVLFGSKARGDDDKESDMDLLVVLKHVSLEIRRQVRDLATETWLDNGVFLSTRVWDESYWHKLASLSTILYRNICEDGILLYQQTPIVK
jgi:uncharacterized protein